MKIEISDCVHIYDKPENWIFQRFQAIAERLPEEDREKLYWGSTDDFYIQRGSRYALGHIPGIIDKTVSIRAEIPFIGKLRGYQQNEIPKIAMAQEGIVIMPVASGKTICMLGLASLLKEKTLIITHTNTLLEQTRLKVKEFCGLEAGQIGNQVFDIDHEITVGLIQTIEKRMDELNDKFGLIITDECITGDSLVETDKGPIPIKNLKFYLTSPVYVLSYGELGLSFQPLKNWWNKGRRMIRKITFENGRSLKCTDEHLIATSMGWIRADKLKIGDRTISNQQNSVPVDVDKEFHDMMQMESCVNLFRDTRCSDSGLIGSREQKNGTKMPRYVNVDVESKFTLVEKHLGGDGLKSHIGQNIFGDIQQEERELSQPFQSNYGDRFSGPCLETPLSISETKEASHPPLALPMDWSRNHGPSLNLMSLMHWGLQQGLSKIRDSVIFLLGDILNVFRTCCQFIKSFARIASQKEFPENGLKKSQPREWHGGIWMTVHWVKKMVVFLFIQKDIHLKKTRLFPLGLKQGDSQTKYEQIKDKTGESSISSDSVLNQAKNGLENSKNSLPPEWNTNLTKVIKTERLISEEEVFDIEVEKNHNFFANGILVHNCHHLSSEMFFNAIAKFKARYRYGFSADIRRSDKKEYLIEAILGKILVKIEADGLARDGYLQLPEIIQVRTNFYIDKPNFCQARCYKRGDCQISINECRYIKNAFWTYMLGKLTQDKDRNALIIKTIEDNLGKYNLVLSDRIKHIEFLKDKFWDNTFLVKGEMKAVERNRVLKEFMQGGGILLATTGLLGEGYDLPAIDRLFLTCPAGTRIIVGQRLGRIMRPKEGEKKVVLDFVDWRSPPLFGIACARMRIYKQMGCKITRIGKEAQNDG